MLGGVVVYVVIPCEVVQVFLHLVEGFFVSHAASRCRYSAGFASGAALIPSSLTFIASRRSRMASRRLRPASGVPPILVSGRLPSYNADG